MAFDLWEPDTLINDHFARRLRSPEKRLLMAVLMDAVAEFQEVVGSSAKEDEPRRRKLTAWFSATRGRARSRISASCSISTPAAFGRVWQPW
jgi:hypothetical protein